MGETKETTDRTDTNTEYETKVRIETTERTDSNLKTETKGRIETIGSTDTNPKTETKGRIETIGRTDSNSKTKTKGKIETKSRTETQAKTETIGKTYTNAKTETKGRIETLGRSDTKPKTERQGRPEAKGGETIITEEIPGTTDETTGTGRVSGVAPTYSLFQEAHVPEISELFDRLDSDELTSLRIHFYEKKKDEKIKEPKGSAHPRFRGFKLKKDEFISAIESVLNTKEFEEAASNLFDRLVMHNAEEHKGFLWWEQILDELIDFMSEKTKSRPGNIVKESFSSLHAMPHCRRETIVRVVPVETPTSFCFVVVSKYGKVGIYDWNMSLLDQYEVRLSTQIATTAGGEVRRTTWVTDALYMSDAATLLVAASDRSLHFYATSGLVCVPVYHISGLQNAPTCLHYTVATSTEGPSMLLVGDDHGSIATMYFQQPQYALFKRTSNDALDTYFWKELSSQKAWVIIAMEHGIHKDEITRVEYFTDNNTVVSCSNDPNTTVIIRYIVGRRAPYVFKVSRGVRCFHLDRTLRLLATGGKDSVVRLWNPIIPRQPIASLFGHKSCIVDVRILKHLSAILSISKDTIVKVWDIVGQTCMQSLPLLFPVHGALARPPEFGVQSFYPGPVSCKHASLAPKGSTEIVLSPRTLTSNSSSALGASKGTTADTAGTSGQSKGGTTLSVKIDTVVSTYTVISGKSKLDTESVQTECSEPYNLTTVASLANDSCHGTRTMTQNTVGTEHEQSDVSNSCVESPWTRMELLAVCCNYIVILQLSERELEEGEDKRVGDPRYAPLRNQDPAAPSPWLTVDSALLAGLTDIDTLPQGEDGVFSSSVPPAVLATLQKSLGDEMTRDFTALASSCYSRDSQQTDLQQIRAMVDQSAPHLALGTTEVEDIRFTAPAAAHIRKSRLKTDEVHGKETQKVTKISMAAEESNISLTPLGTTTTTTTSTSTPKSN